MLKRILALILTAFLCLSTASCSFLRFFVVERETSESESVSELETESDTETETETETETDTETETETETETDTETETETETEPEPEPEPGPQPAPMGWVLPKYEASCSTLRYTDTYNDCVLMTVQNTAQADFEAYLAQFTESAGYQKILETRDVLEGTGNLATMYTGTVGGRTYLINALWIPAVNSINKVNEGKITVEPLRDLDLSVFSPASASVGTVPSLLIQIGLDGYVTAGVYEGTHDQNSNTSGMSYVYRLSDGSFVVFDGGGNSLGTGDRDKDHAARLYHTLKKYSVTEEIVIAAWYITHPHVDHMGAFMAFTGAYLNHPSYKVSLEKVICNLPNVMEQTYVEPWESYSLSEYKIATYNTRLEELRTQGVDIYKAHVGQKYYLRNLTLEILFTYDLLSPSLPDAFFTSDAYGVNRGTVHNTPGSGKDFTNTFSVICQATLKVSDTVSYQAIWTGDATCYGIETVNAMYGAAMKSDFVQVPHHGSIQMDRGSSSDERIRYYHEIQVNHFFGAASEAINDHYPQSVYPELFHSDGSYGFVRAKYILWPSNISRGGYLNGEPGDTGTGNDSRLSTWTPLHHLQKEAQAQGGDVYLARCFLTVFTLGEMVTVEEDHEVIKNPMPSI